MSEQKSGEPYSPQEIEGIVELALKFEEELREKYDPERKIPGREILLQKYRERVKDPSYKVAVVYDEGKMVGYLFGWVNPARAREFGLEDMGWLQGVYVLPEARGRGKWIGMDLLGSFENFVKGKGVNKIGGQFYKGSRQHKLFMLDGWREVREVPDGKEVIMTKDLV